MLSGDVSITQKWKIQYNTTYDLKARKLSSATSFAIYRDLHCWDLSVQWLPFGFINHTTLRLKVKASILQDLKLSKRSDYTNNQNLINMLAEIITIGDEILIGQIVDTNSAWMAEKLNEGYKDKTDLIRI
jgi:hypothetical protein